METKAAMKPGYLLTKADGSTVLLFDGKRAHGLAGHYGWTIKELSAVEAARFLRDELAKTFPANPPPQRHTKKERL